MSSPAEVERKVRQLDNDVQSIYEMLARIEATQARQGNRLGEMDGKLDAILDILRSGSSEKA
ncbi:MAG: hypothetical protein M3548_22895 [Actinomycetota bacterium]|nr:hypothetical protein [Actinomycetota bacterium]